MEPYASMIFVAAYTGLRVSELFVPAAIAKKTIRIEDAASIALASNIVIREVGTTLRRNEAVAR